MQIVPSCCGDANPNNTDPYVNLSHFWQKLKTSNIVLPPSTLCGTRSPIDAFISGFTVLALVSFNSPIFFESIPAFFLYIIVCFSSIFPLPARTTGSSSVSYLHSHAPFLIGHSLIISWLTSRRPCRSSLGLCWRMFFCVWACSRTHTHGQRFFMISIHTVPGHSSNERFHHGSYGDFDQKLDQPCYVKIKTIRWFWVAELNFR